MKQSTSSFPVILFSLLFLISSCQKEGALPLDSNHPVSATSSSQASQPLDFEVASDKFMADFINDRSTLYNSEKDCEKAIQNITNLLQPLANKYCKSYYYCIKCMQDGWPVYAMGFVNPQNCPIESADQYYAIDGDILQSIGLDSDSIPAKEDIGKATTYIPSVSFKVAVQSFDCINGGESLIVYNPADWDAFSDPDLYVVRWYINGVPLRNGYKIDCVCAGEYSAIVYSLALQQPVGIAFYSSTACISDHF